MYGVLHVSERAIQNIIDDLLQIFSLSKPLVRDSITNILHQHSQPVSEVVLNELVEAVMNTNVFVNAATAGAELSTAKRRKTFVRIHYPLVISVQYSLGSSGPTVVYVPVLQSSRVCSKILIFLIKSKKLNNHHLGCTCPIQMGHTVFQREPVSVSSRRAEVVTDFVCG